MWGRCCGISDLKKSGSVYENPIILSQKLINFENNLDNLLKLNQCKMDYLDFCNKQVCIKLLKL